APQERGQQATKPVPMPLMQTGSLHGGDNIPSTHNPGAVSDGSPSPYACSTSLSNGLHT
ncbi:hypothetical protein HAX54_046689, partial [Datura stramonium]|nr:hypothetical protein [Datura stramonium]